MGDLDLLKGPAIAWTETLEAAKQRVLGEIRPLAQSLKEALTNTPALAGIFANHPAARRVISSLEASTASAMELADYAERSFLEDQSELEKGEFLIERIEELAVEVVEMVPTGEVKKIPTGEVEKVPTGEKETYVTEVVVKPAGLFRKAAVAKVERARPVLVERQVCREERHTKVVPGQPSLAVANAFGRWKASFPGSWIEVPPGTFRMGEAAGATTVTITRRFKILSVPMTQALYERVMGTNPSCFPGDVRPVEQVSWLDAVKCCNALSTTLGLAEAYHIKANRVDWDGLDHPGVRLPTEAEWEYACRAGISGEHTVSLDGVAWYDQNSGGQTHPVRQKKPNDWGLYDMQGNVCEWCWDWHSDRLPGGEDPLGPDSGSHHVFRGGSWGMHAYCCRPTNRHILHPSYREDDFGFRPVLPWNK